MNKKFFIASSLALVMLINSSVSAHAWSFKIFGNGADSNNSITAKSVKKTTVTQLNNFSALTSVGISANTGNNKAKKNTGGTNSIITGNISSWVNIVNTGNTNHYSGDACCTDNDHDNDHDCDPDPTPTPTPSPTPTPTPSPTPTPTPEPCEERTVWGDEVEDHDQGTLKTGSPITDPDRTDPQTALGSPDGDFFSLGDNGWITIKFASPVANIAGDDLSFHEVTNGRDTYPEERASVEVSEDGSVWYDIGEISGLAGGDGVDYLDFDSTGLSQIRWVRITDATNFLLHNDEADGYDLDAVDAVKLVCEQ